jgi:hypothetical protein
MIIHYSIKEAIGIKYNHLYIHKSTYNYIYTKIKIYIEIFLTDLTRYISIFYHSFFKFHEINIF